MMAAGTYQHLHNHLDLALLLSIEAFQTKISTKTREAVRRDSRLLLAC